MKNRKSVSAAILALAALLSGCQTTGTNEQLGAIIGGAAGGIIGNQASGKNKALWTAVGVGAGAFIGSRIGRHLDEQDKQRMAEAAQRAAATGEAHSWSNPENNTQGQARVVSTQTRQEPVKVAILKEKVKQVPPLDIIGQTYRAKKVANLRGGPGTDYVKVGSLSTGEAVNVVGKVKTSDWYLISQDGVGSGFIYSPLVEPAPTATPTPTGAQIAQADVQEQQIASSKVCRTVEQSVTLADGSSHSETIEACQGANGWERQA